MKSGSTTTITAAPPLDMWGEAAKQARDHGELIKHNDKLTTRRVDKIVRDAKAKRISLEELHRRLEAASLLPGFVHAVAILDLSHKSR